MFVENHDFPISKEAVHPSGTVQSELPHSIFKSFHIETTYLVFWSRVVDCMRNENRYIVNTDPVTPCLLCLPRIPTASGGSGGSNPSMALFFLIFFLFHFRFIWFHFVLISYSKIFPNAPKWNWCGGRREVGECNYNHWQQPWDRHRGLWVGLQVLFRRNYRNLQWNRGVSTAWTSNAYCSECWNLAEITLFLMKFDDCFGLISVLRPFDTF